MLFFYRIFFQFLRIFPLPLYFSFFSHLSGLFTYYLTLCLLYRLTAHIFLLFLHLSQILPFLALLCLLLFITSTYFPPYSLIPSPFFSSPSHPFIYPSIFLFLLPFSFSPPLLFSLLPFVQEFSGFTLLLTHLLYL